MKHLKLIDGVEPVDQAEARYRLREAKIQWDVRMVPGTSDMWIQNTWRNRLIDSYTWNTWRYDV